MGYLHAGHASLMAAARADTDLVVASIFVNPLQFGPTEDLDAYPRDLDGRHRAGRGARASTSCSCRRPRRCTPTAPCARRSRVAEVSEPLEGAARPTHFAGVATVVAKLFAIVGPCRAYFGEKDFQQVAVIRQMVQRPVDPRRGRRLPHAARARRPRHVEPQRLPHAPRSGPPRPSCTRRCTWVALAIDAGERDPARVRALMAELIEAEPLAELDYAEVVDARTLQVVDPLAGELRLLAAVRFGRARLIDNVGRLGRLTVSRSGARRPARAGRPGGRGSAPPARRRRASRRAAARGTPTAR